jgi:hypothetical protein
MRQVKNPQIRIPSRLQPNELRTSEFDAARNGEHLAMVAWNRGIRQTAIYDRLILDWCGGGDYPKAGKMSGRYPKPEHAMLQ